MKVKVYDRQGKLVGPVESAKVVRPTPSGRPG